jgi:hypothetical protein
MDTVYSVFGYTNTLDFVVSVIELPLVFTILEDWSMIPLLPVIYVFASTSSPFDTSIAEIIG